MREVENLRCFGCQGVENSPFREHQWSCFLTAHCFFPKLQANMPLSGTPGNQKFLVSGMPGVENLPFPGHQGVKNLRCPGDQGVENPLCPRHQGVVFVCSMDFFNFKPLLQTLKQHSIKKQCESNTYFSHSFGSCFKDFPNFIFSDRLPGVQSF